MVPAYRVFGGAIVISTAVTAIADGPWALLPLLGLVAMAVVVPRVIRKLSRPEYAVVAAAILVIATTSFAIARTGSLNSPLAFLLLVPGVTLPLRFNTRGVAAGIVTLLLILVGVGLIVNGHALMAASTKFIAFAATLTSIATCTSILVRAEFRYRRASVLDPLTGLLNRNSLAPRFEELSAQAAMTEAPIALVACDIDYFKSVNDNHGHHIGDTILEQVAYEMRKTLRSFELIYRMGGEEFLLVLPGADLADGEEVAELIRDHLERLNPTNIRITASLGVSAATGPGIELAPLYEAADAALYEAKRDGRNCVRPTTDQPQTSSARRARNAPDVVEA